jgi:hypothetical protein
LDFGAPSSALRPLQPMALSRGQPSRGAEAIAETFVGSFPQNSSQGPFVMIKSNLLKSNSCLSRGELAIETTARGSFRINVPACNREHCALRMLASDLGLQSDKRGLFLTTDNGATTELEARAYFAAWRFFANRLLSENRLWAEALGH